MHHVPAGHNVVTPILMVTDADGLIAFLKATFDAREYQITRRPDGKIWHADLTIDGAHVMLGEAGHGMDPAVCAVNVYVPDVDATYQRALAGGAESMMPPSDRFYGDRNAVVKDRFGVIWSLATHVEDVAPAELKRREEAAVREMAQKG